jgi:Ca2+-binding RTX toxin-like protein
VAVIALAGGSSRASTEQPTRAVLLGNHPSTILIGSKIGEEIAVTPAGKKKLQIADTAGITIEGPGHACELKSKTEAICKRPTRSLRLLGEDGPDRVVVSVNLRTPDEPELLGGDGADLLIDGHGSSFIGGGNSHDRLRGGPGQDYIEGNAGPDSFHAGPGNDRVIAAGPPHQKGDRDSVIDCGSGRDRYRVGEADPKPRGCERPEQ